MQHLVVIVKCACKLSYICCTSGLSMLDLCCACYPSSSKYTLTFCPVITTRLHSSSNSQDNCMCCLQLDSVLERGPSAEVMFSYDGGTMYMRDKWVLHLPALASWRTFLPLLPLWAVLLAAHLHQSSLFDNITPQKTNCCNGCAVGTSTPHRLRRCFEMVKRFSHR